MIADASGPSLSVMGVDAANPVTEIFRLPADI